MKQAFTTCLTESVSTWRRREIILALPRGERSNELDVSSALLTTETT